MPFVEVWCPSAVTCSWKDVIDTAEWHILKAWHRKRRSQSGDDRPFKRNLGVTFAAEPQVAAPAPKTPANADVISPVPLLDVTPLRARRNSAPADSPVNWSKLEYNFVFFTFVLTFFVVPLVPSPRCDYCSCTCSYLCHRACTNCMCVCHSPWA